MSRLGTSAGRAGTIARVLVCIVGLCLWPTESSAQQALADKPAASVLADVDSSVSPCNDFYQYANGSWYKRTQVAEGKSASFFSEMADSSKALMLEMLEQARKAPSETTDPAIKSVGTFYGSCMTDTYVDSIDMGTTTGDAQKNKAVRSVWCQDMTTNRMQDAFYQAYIKTVMPPPTKRRVEAMLAGLKAAMRKRLQGTPWMSDSTKHLVLEKLDEMQMIVGYPSTWNDYSILTLSPTDFRQNQKTISDFLWKRQLTAIGGAPVVGALTLEPTMVNAFYFADRNAFEVPVVMFQSPFFTTDEASSYGASGYVIGHETTHGYDHKEDWWIPTDTVNFSQRTQALSAQYAAVSKLHVFDSLHIESASAEDVADLNGTIIAYTALEEILQGKPRTLVDGMTPEQRFFTARARVWRTKPVVVTSGNQYSPPAGRVNMVLRNMPEFAKAYGCTAGDPMVATPAVQVW